MSRLDDIRSAQDDLARNWGEEFVVLCHEQNPFNGNMDSFLTHCIMCGGDWGGILLTGILELYPVVYDAIPDNMGFNAFMHIVNTLILLGVRVD